MLSGESPLNFDIIFRSHISNAAATDTPRGGAQITRTHARLYAPGGAMWAPRGGTRACLP